MVSLSIKRANIETIATITGSPVSAITLSTASFSFPNLESLCLIVSLLTFKHLYLLAIFSYRYNYTKLQYYFMSL